MANFTTFNGYTVEDSEARSSINSINERITTLTSQVENLTSIEEGSTTGDAELIDIRTAFDGTIYNTAGDSVRGQANKLIQRIRDVQNGYNETTLYFNDHITGYIKADGTLSSMNAQWGRTDYIRIKSPTIEFNISSIQPLATNGFNVGFYDEQLNFISGISFDEYINTPNVNVTLTVPPNTLYFVYCNTLAKWNITDNCIFTDFYKKTFHVSTDGTQDFTSLTDAVNNAKDGDVIYVHQGIYENEHVKGWGKSLTIIGDSPLNTIIKCSDSAYENPCIEFSTGAIYNLQFIKDCDETGYTMHIEDDYQYGKSLYMENCILKSPNGNVIGLGMRGNSSIIFNNCQFISKAQGSVMYIHDSANHSLGGNYDLQFHNCYFENGGNYILHLQSQEDLLSLITLTFINNTFFGTPFNTPSVATANYYNSVSENEEDFKGLISWRLKGCSRNNSLSDLNR